MPIAIDGLISCSRLECSRLPLSPMLLQLVLCPCCFACESPLLEFRFLRDACSTCTCTSVLISHSLSINGCLDLYADSSSTVKRGNKAITGVDSGGANCIASVLHAAFGSDYIVDQQVVRVGLQQIEAMVFGLFSLY